MALRCAIMLALVVAVEMDDSVTRAAEEAPSANVAAAPCPSPEIAPKRVGLVAHDARKMELLAWVEKNASLLAAQKLYCTGTTGRLVNETLGELFPGRAIDLTRFNSGPLGGDLEMGALVAQGGLDILVFFVDPLTSHPHDADIKALLRMCAVTNTVLAITPSTADYVIASPHFIGGYAVERPDYTPHVNRPLTR